MDLTLLHEMSQPQIRALERGIQSAFVEHVGLVARSLDILTPCGEADLSLIEEDAHRKCGFGTWFYGKVPQALRASDDFRRLGQLHRRFHLAARQAVSSRAQGRMMTQEECRELAQSESELLIALNSYLMEVAEGLQVFDELTGLLNRQEMTRLLGRERSRSERTGAETSIAMADLDHFKGVNDRHGHAAGDAVLRRAAQIFASELRDYDLLFRIGGEEFLFCFPETSTEEARQICDRIRKSMENARVDVPGHPAIAVTVSFGVAPLNPDLETGDSIRMADRALYEAKESGRNRVALAKV